MKFGPRTPRFLVAPLALVAMAALTACESSTAPPTLAELAIVRLNIGSQTILFDQNGLKTCCDGAGNPTLNTRITLTNTGSVLARTHTTFAAFFTERGIRILQEPGGVDPAVYRLEITTSGPEVTWTPDAGAPAIIDDDGEVAVPARPADPFRGTFFRNGVGIIQVEMRIVEQASGSLLFGPHSFNICTTTDGVPATEGGGCGT